MGMEDVELWMGGARRQALRASRRIRRRLSPLHVIINFSTHFLPMRPMPECSSFLTILKEEKAGVIRCLLI